MNINELTYKAIQDHNWKEMDSLLSRMNILDFRRIQTNVRTKILPEKENDDFWETYLHLIIFRKQAFLAGILAAEKLAKTGKINFNNEHVKQLSVYLQKNHPDAITGLLNLALSILISDSQITDMFDAFNINERTRIASLLKTNLVITYYALFKELKQIQDKDIIRKSCLYIMKKNDDMSLNMACIIKEYFGLSGIKVNKTLNIEPYELSYIDRNKETFSNVLLGKRPKL